MTGTEKKNQCTEHTDRHTKYTFHRTQGILYSYYSHVAKMLNVCWKETCFTTLHSPFEKKCIVCAVDWQTVQEMFVTYNSDLADKSSKVVCGGVCLKKHVLCLLNAPQRQARGEGDERWWWWWRSIVVVGGEMSEWMCDDAMLSDAAKAQLLLPVVVLVVVV